MHNKMFVFYKDLIVQYIIPEYFAANQTVDILLRSSRHVIITENLYKDAIYILVLF